MGAKDTWVEMVEKEMADFASKYAFSYQKNERQVAAFFEIGCFLALSLDYQNQGFEVKPLGLRGGSYRYLTTPSGNPNNFSYLGLELGSEKFELRQQVRIRSHLHRDICVTPDFVVLWSGADISGERDNDFAGGKRGFFVAESRAVIAGHECKCMKGFPELYASFIGISTVVHIWHLPEFGGRSVRGPEGHLAPSLFVGAEASNLHRRLIKALEAQFPINIITGIHSERKLGKLGKNLARLPLGRLATLPESFGPEPADEDIPF